MRLDDLVTALEAAALPRRGVVITFDDGYVDNVVKAKPLLEASEMPATVFVTSGCLDHPIEYWWDRLERALLQQEQLPESLALQLENRTYEWATTDSQERLHAYMAIHGVLKSMPVVARDRALDAIVDWAGIDPGVPADCRPMTAGEVIELGQGEWIDIGSHSVTHPLLTSLSEADQHAEIINSRKALEQCLGRRVNAFSYPGGKLNPDTVRIVRDAGFSAGLMAHGDPVRTGTDPFRLGRLGIGDWEATPFTQRLEAFFKAQEWEAHNAP
jgi:peptidoglycan/xylan/chitin deacetylase (PgdA/CDA1 family)